MIPENKELNYIRKQAWAPGHATLFFAVPKYYSDPSKMGSLGAGFNFNSGVLTKVEKSPDLFVTWNNHPINGVATKRAYELFCDHTGFAEPVKISHHSELKIGYGLSTSGAGTIGAVLALQDMTKEKIDKVELFEIAHRSEVENKTGLGSVIGQMTSGIEMRFSQGGPKIADLKSYESNKQIILFMIGELKTSKVLVSSNQMKKITQAGLDSIKQAELIKSNYLNELIKIGQKFTEKCGLETKKVRDIREKLLQIGEDRVTMAMIGETLVIQPRNSKKIISFARKYDIDCLVTTITNQKPYIIQ